jgi:hypothetical protein
MERFPDDLAIARQYAMAADYRQDWGEALRRWNALVTRFPNDRTVLEGRGETEARQRLVAIDSSQEISNTSAPHQFQGRTEEGNRTGRRT